MSNSIEVPTQNLIPALNLQETKNYTLASLSNDGVYDTRLAEEKLKPSSPDAVIPVQQQPRVGASVDIGNQSLLQNQMLQGFNRKPIVGGQVLDQSLNTQLAS